MRVSKKLLDNAYASGREYARKGIPPNPGASMHPHERYLRMAHMAGWQDGKAEFDALVERLWKRDRDA